MIAYTLYDRVKQDSTGIMLYKNDAEACRARDHAMAKMIDTVATPDDFKLIKLGKFDTETCEFDSTGCPSDVIETVEGGKDE